MEPTIYDRLFGPDLNKGGLGNGPGKAGKGKKQKVPGDKVANRNTNPTIGGKPGTMQHGVRGGAKVPQLDAVPKHINGGKKMAKAEEMPDDSGGEDGSEDESEEATAKGYKPMQIARWQTGGEDAYIAKAIADGTLDGHANAQVIPLNRQIQRKR